MSEQLLHQILQKLDQLDFNVQTITRDVESLKGTQELMQTQLGETNAIVRAIRDRQDETDAKLDALSMDVHKLHGELSSLKEGQERHEKILEKLSIRSLEHEADIREIKLAK